MDHLLVILSGPLEKIIEGQDAGNFFIDLKLRERMEDGLKIGERECYQNSVQS